MIGTKESHFLVNSNPRNFDFWTETCRPGDFSQAGVVVFCKTEACFTFPFATTLQNLLPSHGCKLAQTFR